MDSERILIYQTAFLGDLVLTTPLIKSVKKFFPYSQVFVAVRRGLEDALKNLRFVDGVISVEKKKTLEPIRILRELKISLVFSPHRSHRTSLILFFSGIPERIGFKNSGFSFLYTKTVEYRKELHEVERNLQLLTPFGIKPDGESPELVVLKSEEEAVVRKFSIKLPFVALFPGANWGTKRWLPEYFAEVGDFLVKRGFNVVIGGTKKDADACLKVCEFMKERCLNVCGKTNLREFFAIVKLASLVVSNDSSPVHVATALGTPVIEIFGPTVPEFGFYPYKNGKWVSLTLKCKPCNIHGPEKCPERHHKCMKDLKPEMVIEKIEELLIR